MDGAEKPTPLISSLAKSQEEDEARGRAEKDWLELPYRGGEFLRGDALEEVDGEDLDDVEVNLVDADLDVDEEHSDGLLVHLDADKEVLDGTELNFS